MKLFAMRSEKIGEISEQNDRGVLISVAAQLGPLNKSSHEKYSALLKEEEAERFFLAQLRLHKRKV